MVYSYTPALATDVTISTCGSGFDTKLLVSTNLSDPTTYMCNDDDRTCVSNTACSRLDVSLEVGVGVRVVASSQHTCATCSVEAPPGATRQERSCLHQRTDDAVCVVPLLSVLLPFQPGWHTLLHCGGRLQRRVWRVQPVCILQPRVPK